MPATFSDLVCRASTIDERLGAGFIPNPAGASGEELDRRLDQWCRIAADGDWRRFEQRLARDGLTPESARRALAPVRLREGAPLPPWAETLRVALLRSSESATSDRCLQPASPLPFQELCLPFLSTARARLAETAKSACDLLSGDALAALERHLLKRLSAVSSQTFYLEFSIFRQLQRSGLGGLTATPSEDPRRIYTEFVRDLLNGKLIDLFLDYSVLARRMASVTALWIEATSELLLRLERDAPALAKAFGNGTGAGRVIDVESGLSDPHDGGRGVALLTWESGLKLLYKPRDLSLDRAYNELVEWLNDRGSVPPLRVCRFLTRPGYGWMDVQECRPCASIEDAENYFRRAGMHLCLVYALRGGDLHDENVIASGDQPLLVDLEVLLQPRPCRKAFPMAGPDDPAHQELGDSVLGTGLLPWWLSTGDGRTWNLAGLGMGTDEESMYRLPQWRNVNSDAMELTFDYQKLSPRANVARLGGEPLSPARFEQQLLDGFTRMYRRLLEHRQALLADDGALSRFARLPVRFLFRPTSVYASYILTAIRPAFSGDGVVAALQLDRLSRDLERSPALWPLLTAEKNALECMDIPRFSTRSDSEALQTGSGSLLEHCFAEASFDSMVKQIRRMSEDDLAWQLHMIRGALHAYQTDGAAHVEIAGCAHQAYEGTALTREEALTHALKIAQRLEQRAVRSEGGSAGWIGLMPIPGTSRLQLQPVWYGLYYGGSGIALFLAALERVTGQSGHRDLCLAALRPFREALRNCDGVPPYIGPTDELGLVIYGLTRTAMFLDDASLLDDARRLARYITQERIAADRDFDVLSGGAGVLLALLTLHEVAPDDNLLASAVACGLQLLERRAAGAGGLRSWPTIDGQLVAGFSHGAAGIAYALLRLAHATAGSSFMEAALEAIAYEQSLFDAAEGNWPRLPIAARNGRNFPAAWCYGAPGIGLARAAALGLADTPAIRADIDAALSITRKAGLQSADHLCCGNFGCIDFLLSAGLKLGRADLVELARRQAAHVVARAAAQGRYALRGFDGDRSADLYPGLFQGEAGIGYELLRLADPDHVPSVLAFQ